MIAAHYEGLGLRAGYFFRKCLQCVADDGHH